MSGEIILLVDDEVDFRYTLAERLRYRGFIVCEAGDEKEAFDQIHICMPQLIVLDIVLPGASGYQILKRIKAELPNLPVIVLTGLGTSPGGVELGAFDYLLKPVDLDLLLERIGRAIGKESL
ncbi:response regulator [Desulfomonile tiedjei]|uniref:Response regulator with CheY-like receiver, AAA-type ATPase, and DNA-binding domains n=1 Tax=Desulfomonile tiedjei (strain ATCC 49306 / DSM 6799 / DCB-1) TaxID=706587 RepID=I4CBN2_DESTA|nr:response regulator [Desulfomonile tiedjei]AFM26973.1 response regulator with CheY-like receiver, AAA-type ATPase, and DNA-binding domains [Desulfomonile tiedjei DSM 6799]